MRDAHYYSRGIYTQINQFSSMIIVVHAILILNRETCKLHVIKYTFRPQIFGITMRVLK